jgi:hypothetical protein
MNFSIRHQLCDPATSLMGEIAPSNHQIRSWVDSRASPVAVVKRKISASSGHSAWLSSLAACGYNDQAILAPTIYTMLYSSVAI